MKILFLQLEGPTIGGIWEVNHTLASSFALSNEVCIISQRKSKCEIKINSSIKLITINNNVWERVRINEIIKNKSFKLLKQRIKQNISRKKDYQEIKKYINEIKPDIIINSHYELLDAIPIAYLKKTINVFHTSYKNIKENNYLAIKKLKKYQNKILKLVWLTKETCNLAIKDGLINSTYIYNPVKFKTKKHSNVTKNKKLITIARLSSTEKNIDEMLSIADKVLKKHTDWTLELYGPGLPNNLETIKNNKNIILKGITNNVEECLLEASIYLSTSIYEGFCLSILEANTCGIPVITYNFGESCHEEVINDINGYIVKDEQEFIQKLDYLITNHDKLEELSKKSIEFAKNFDVDIIIEKWYNLMGEI